ncbi:mitochondrial peripheral inner membrane protein [Xanthoria parietina]
MIRCHRALPRKSTIARLVDITPCRPLHANRHSSPPTVVSSSAPSKTFLKRRWPWLVGVGLIGPGIWLGYTGVLGTWLGSDVGTDGAQADVFQDYELIKNQKISSTSYVFKIQPSTFGPRAYKSRLDGQKITEASKKGIWSVQIKHPLLTIARLYTPIPTILRDPYAHTLGEKANYHSLNPQDNQLRFLIRNHPEGELSRFLSRLQPGARIELRGPYQEFEFPEDLDQVVFLAGGTGISPALQMAHTLLEDRSAAPKPRMTILWANRLAEDCKGGSIEPPHRPDGLLQQAWRSMFGYDDPQLAISPVPSLEDSPVVRELSALELRHPGYFKVGYFADDKQRFISDRDIQAHVQKVGSYQNQRPSDGRSGKNLIMVSGPDGFVEHFAGPKVWSEGRELQGTLGGLLGKMQLSEWAIWKL